MATMKEIKAAAKKRRGGYLDEMERLDVTAESLAEKHGITPARMGQLLKKARAERNLSERSA